jgi:hypothetical protein
MKNIEDKHLKLKRYVFELLGVGECGYNEA